MTQYALIIDIERCVGCYACEVACKQENNIPPGSPSWIQVVQVGPRLVGDELTLHFVPTVCKHCANPPCIEACPEDAISKRDDGIVLIDTELCIGCKACIEACPFKAPQFNEEQNVVEKCTLCVHRVEKGLQPNCAAHCPVEAIYFGDPTEIAQQLRKEYAVYHVKKT
ncbi:MAG: 4Fe-4S dicluster domain-containing protein [Promethearchaeota archaeon]